MCTGCDDDNNSNTGLGYGTHNYDTKFEKPKAMVSSKSVSKNSVGFTFGPYGARKASEVIGRTTMPPMPKKRAGRQF